MIRYADGSSPKKVGRIPMRTEPGKKGPYISTVILLNLRADRWSGKLGEALIRECAKVKVGSEKSMLGTSTTKW